MSKFDNKKDKLLELITLFITGGSHGRAWTFGVLSARSALGKLDDSLDGLGS